MSDELIKIALSYSLGSDLHEAWRAPRKLEDGTYEPRMKKSKDEAWNALHGTDDVDIANCSFDELPSNWQYENLEAAKVVIGLVYDKTIAGGVLTPEEVEELSSIIHDEWLKRNDWVYNPEYGNPTVAVPYDQLPEDEKEKDRAQLKPAIDKVHAYVDGIIDINKICEKFNLSEKSKTM